MYPTVSKKLVVGWGGDATGLPIKKRPRVNGVKSGRELRIASIWEMRIYRPTIVKRAFANYSSNMMLDTLYACLPQISEMWRTIGNK